MKKYSDVVKLLEKKILISLTNPPEFPVWLTMSHVFAHGREEIHLGLKRKRSSGKWEDHRITDKTFPEAIIFCNYSKNKNANNKWNKPGLLGNLHS